MELHDSPVPDDVDVERESGVPKHLEQVYKAQAAKQKRGQRKVLIVVIILVVVLVIGGGGYLLLHHKAKTPVKQATTSNQNLPAPAANTSSNTTDYTAPADGLNLSFSYPDDWTVDPASGQSGNTITVTSPLVSLPDAASGADVTGKVTIMIRGDTSNIKELASNKATAPQDSVQYAYKAPTAAQHQYFYVSFLQFASPATAAGAFQEVAITGINQIPKNTAITSDLLAEVDPLVTASFNKCTATVCTEADQTPIGIKGASWQNDKTLLQVQALFESLKFN